METSMGGIVFPAPPNAPSKTISNAMKTCDKDRIRKYPIPISTTLGSEMKKDVICLGKMKNIMLTKPVIRTAMVAVRHAD